MTNAKPGQASPLFVPGGTQQAQYHDTPIANFRHNPLVEALPPILSADEAAVRLLYRPPYSEADRYRPAHERLLLTRSILKVRVPLPNVLDLEQRLGSLLRWGYEARNPLPAQFWRDARARVDQLNAADVLEYPELADAGLTMIGISGIGKTTAHKRVLSLYQQIIIHSDYRGTPFTFTQIVYIRLECPHNGALGNLAVNFFRTLDRMLGTTYYMDYTRGGTVRVDDMLASMAHVCLLHGIGLVIIDEIQRLSIAKSGGAKTMLNFFVQLVNEIGVPVVLIGTYGAIPVLGGELRQARRGTQEGDMYWHRMLQDDTWEEFLSWIWPYQYTRNTCDLTEELSDALYDVSQGITDFAVKAYMLAQKRAIVNETEVITADLIRSVVKDELASIVPALNALRAGDDEELQKYEDLYPFGLDASVPGEPEAAVGDTLAAPVGPADPAAQPADQPRKPRRTRAKRPSASEGLLNAVETGRADDITGHEALRQAGFIAPIAPPDKD